MLSWWELDCLPQKARAIHYATATPSRYCISKHKPRNTAREVFSILLGKAKAYIILAVFNDEAKEDVDGGAPPPHGLIDAIMHWWASRCLRVGTSVLIDIIFLYRHTHKWLHVKKFQLLLFLIICAAYFAGRRTPSQKCQIIFSIIFTTKYRADILREFWAKADELLITYAHTPPRISRWFTPSAMATRAPPPRHDGPPW